MLFWALSAGTTTYLSCIIDNVFATSGSLKTDVALALIDLLKTFIRFKIKDFSAFNHSDRDDVKLMSGNHEKSLKYTFQTQLQRLVHKQV